LFFIGIVLLLVSADIFVKICSKLSQALKISPLVIGTTIVAIGTSLPELIVSLLACVRSDFGLAVGNILGSNIINVFLVLAVGIILGNINIGTSKTQRNALYLLVVTLLFVLLTTSLRMPVFSGLIMIALAIGFSFFEIHLGILGRNHEDKVYANGRKKYKFDLKMAFLLLFSLLGVVSGGIMAVTSIEKIAVLTGYSTTILGLSITAIATSMPELLTTIFSRKKDEGKIAIGNILGSNIYNLLLVGGIISLFSKPVTITPFEWTMFFLATAFLVSLIFLYRGRKVPKKIGIVLLLFFVVYLLTLK